MKGVNNQQILRARGCYRTVSCCKNVNIPEVQVINVTRVATGAVTLRTLQILQILQILRILRSQASHGGPTAHVAANPH